jgi:hypothetical protein
MAIASRALLAPGLQSGLGRSGIDEAFVRTHRRPIESAKTGRVISVGSSSIEVKAVNAAEPVNSRLDAPATRLSGGAPQDWTPSSWGLKTALQQPKYPDQDKLEGVVKTLEGFPPLVFAGEARSLEERLGDAAMGKAFLMQGGDCAESFKEFNANNIRDTFRLLLQMGVVLMFGGQVPVIKVCVYLLHMCLCLLFSHLNFPVCTHMVLSTMLNVIAFALGFDDDIVFCQTAWPNGRTVCKAQVIRL